jgi:1,4-alpha-glucan branching enzyme
MSKGKSGSKTKAPRGQPAPPPDLARADLDRLFALRHSDPHAILGAHPSGAGLILRAYRPDAARVYAVFPGEAPRPMDKRDPAGLWEIVLPERRGVAPYALEVHWHDGTRFLYEDPYAFLPTLGELDLHLFGEGRHERIDEKLGAHPISIQNVPGVAFAVWAPNAQGVSLVGDFNGWDGRLHPMRLLGSSGVWELFVPGLHEGARYKFEVRGADGRLFLKADPFAQACEVPPATASVIRESHYQFHDHAWMEHRRQLDPLHAPMSIYEVHLGSWRHVPEESNRPLRYREAAVELADYVASMGFSHVEFLPLTEFPFGGSWGYQVSAYYAATARYGDPDDLRFLVDQLHQRGIGVILDWVPAHFPKDAFALGRYDGTALYEHLDPRQGEHPDWGTFVFNFGRPEVRNFLIGSALYWLRSFHVDGLRLDAVASMLYLDYSRKEGDWVPNAYGGRENLEAIVFLKELNTVTHRLHPGVLMIAEESTAWPGVSRPTYTGGLGFGFKWNMGWMHDTLHYFTREPVHRKYHQNDLTFGLLYAWSENFVLPLSHDEVVHGKGSLIGKMPGDRWQKFANLRALYGYMWAYPGKKLLFMGGEFGQWNEWDHNQSLDWHLLGEPDHAGLQRLVRDLNRIYRQEGALWEEECDWSGFQWIDLHNAQENVLIFMRKGPRSGRQVICVCNFSPVPRHGYRVGLPRGGQFREILNTDAAVYGGGNLGNAGGVWAESRPWQGQPCSAEMLLPPLATIWLEAPR